MIPMGVLASARQGAGGGAGAADPYWPNVASLLHFDGSIADQTGKVWTAHGGAAVSTAQSRFGGSSLDLTGGGYITTPAHADFGFGPGAYTLEGWNFYAALGGADQCLFDNRSASNQGIGIYIGGSGGTGYLRLFSNAAQLASSALAGFTLGMQQHWEVSRDGGGTVRGFIGGALVFTVTDARTLASSAQPFIGANYLGTQPALSYADEIRITKGIARDTSSFTPRTTPFPNFGP